MKLKKIKADKDEYCTEFTFSIMKILKKEFNLPSNAKIYYLGYKNWFIYFLYKNIIFVVYGLFCENKKIASNIQDIYKITLLNNQPKSVNDFKFEVVKSHSDLKYSEKKFLNFLNTPSNITEEIDLPYSKIIELFQNSQISTFEFNDYIYYIKRDKDLSYSLNFYAKNKKNNTTVKIYIPSKWERYSETFSCYLKVPNNLREIFVYDFSKKLSDYQKRKFKTNLLKFLKEENKTFANNNFYTLNLIKQIIQPVGIHRGWSIHRIFCSPNEFSNIWVDDFLSYDLKPYFFIADSNSFPEISKIAVLNFKEEKYTTTGIYKQGCTKFLHWNLPKDYLEKLVNFLKSPYTGRETFLINHGVKTNWQKLIFEYNYNTALEGHLGEEIDSVYEVLPLDLPMPDYTKLASV